MCSTDTSRDKSSYSRYSLYHIVSQVVNETLNINFSPLQFLHWVRIENIVQMIYFVHVFISIYENDVHNTRKSINKGINFCRINYMQNYFSQVFELSFAKVNSPKFFDNAKFAQKLNSAKINSANINPLKVYHTVKEKIWQI